jgi:hypothetical protein
MWWGSILGLRGFNMDSTATLNGWRRKYYGKIYYTGYRQEAVERDLHRSVSGRYSVHHGKKLKVWKVETGRGGCCGNLRWQTHEGMKSREKIIKCLVLIW